MRLRLILVSAALSAAPLPAAAEVTASSDRGFVSHNEVLVDVSPAQAWAEMLRPAGWWNGDHSYSGNAANMTIDARVGGCFCEAIPGPAGEPAGQIEHMRVLYLAPGSTLRMTGGLGPLQSEAVTAVLTMTVKPEGEMTRISWDYVVGGYGRLDLARIAPLVDMVIGEQFERLGKSLSPAD